MKISKDELAKYHANNKELPKSVYECNDWSISEEVSEEKKHTSC